MRTHDGKVIVRASDMRWCSDTFEIWCWDNSKVRIEWLSDNGSIYTANKTREFAKELGLDACTTQAYSPERNGLAEAFVKTFKRDYVRVHDIETAEEVLLQLHKSFDDYNNNHPHMGLKMKSPCECRRLQLRRTG